MQSFYHTLLRLVKGFFLIKFDSVRQLGNFDAISTLSDIEKENFLTVICLRIDNC